MVLPVITPYGTTLGRVDQSGVEQVDVAFKSVPQRCLRALPQGGGACGVMKKTLSGTTY